MKTAGPLHTKRASPSKETTADSLAPCEQVRNCQPPSGESVTDSGHRH
jgi:hypothetical protein